MDLKTIFVRTSKGENEIQSQSMHLPGDIRRSLLMVDGEATFKEIRKRAAPSLRNSLEQMFNDLLQAGYIQEKSTSGKTKTGNIPKLTVPSRMVVPSKMIVPSKMAVPDKNSADEEGDNGLDFSSVIRAQPREAPPVEAVSAGNQRETEAEANAIDQARKQKAQAIARAEAQARAVVEAMAKKEAEAEDRAAIEIQALALEEARARAEAESRARAGAKAKLEADAMARIEAEAKEKLEAEAKARAKAELLARELAEAKAKLEAEAKARAEAEAKAKAKLEADAMARIEAEAKAKLEAEAKARAEAEAKLEVEAKARAKAELLARELAEAKAKLEAEAKARAEAEAKAKLEADAMARIEAEAKAKLEAEAKARAEAEAKLEVEAKARTKAELLARELAEAKAKLEAEMSAKVEKELKAARLSAMQQAGAALSQSAPEPVQGNELVETDQLGTREYPLSRTISATVLFFDVVGYTKKSVNTQIEIKKQFNMLVSDCLKLLGEDDRIILDTGDGAAIGFTHHPEDALNVAIQFRKTVIANQHNDYPDIQVRVGIHLGPINIFKDMNGRDNMVGDGINDAQRVMSFAGPDQIYISRSYFDFISRLSIEYANLFSYMGSLKDKHGREHPVYKLVDVEARVGATEPPLANSDAWDVKLEPFTIPGAAAPSATSVAHSKLGMGKDDDALLNDIGKFTQPEASASEHAPNTTPTSKKVKSEVEDKPSTDEIKKLEHAQAKVWAEAEQRAKEVAKAKALWDVGQPLPATRVSTPLTLVKRKPYPWLKLGAGLMVVLLIVLFVAPFVVPTREYVPRIERLLSSKMQQPVYIGHLEGRLLPTPRLDLIDMSIGEAKQIKSRLARVNFAIPTLFTEVKSIDSVELQGVQINGIALQQVSAWLQKAAADVEYPISRILLSEGKLEAEGFELSGVSGVLNFNQVGKFTAKLYAEGSKFTLDINSALGRKTGVSVSVRGSALPLLPNWIFDDLTAKGELTDKELVITELDSHILGGTLSGNARLGWRSGWQAQGLLVAETINIQNMLKSLSGDMSGTARFQMQATSLTKLADAATLEGSFVIKKGVVNGIDMVETTRLRSTENMPGGRTHFDELRGNLSYARGTYAYRQLKMTGGVLTAKGTLNYAEQQAAGSIIADLTMREMAPVALELGGTRDNPTLRAVR